MIGDETVRQRILREHAILRVLIKRLQKAAQGAADDAGFAQDLRDAGRTLHLVLEAHALLEEQLFGPAIVASRRPRLLEDLHEHHARALAGLQRLRGRGIENYAATALRLVPYLFAALDLEDRELSGGAGDAPAPEPRKKLASLRVGMKGRGSSLDSMGRTRPIADHSAGGSDASPPAASRPADAPPA
jgi:hypothetical protein